MAPPSRSAGMIRSTTASSSVRSNFPSLPDPSVGEAHRPDMVEVAIALRVVDPVADHELVRDLEADPARLHLDLAPRRLVEQRADLDPLGMARVEDFEHVLERVAGVDDVLDQQHVAPLDLPAKVLEDAHFAAGL